MAVSDIKYGCIVDKGPEGTWLCTIVKHDKGGAPHVVRIGVEQSDMQAAGWGQRTVELIRKTGDETAHVNDAIEDGRIRSSPVMVVKH